MKDRELLPLFELSALDLLREVGHAVVAIASSEADAVLPILSGEVAIALCEVLEVLNLIRGGVMTSSVGWIALSSEGDEIRTPVGFERPIWE